MRKFSPKKSLKKSSNSTDVVIELRDVWKTYQVGETQVHALRGLNLKVFRGEFLAVVGPSGSGKSTAMNMIGVLDRPTKGDSFIDGENINKFSESELAIVRGKKIGFIFQKFNLINTLTALENVLLPLTFQNYPSSERKRLAEKMLKLVDLENRMNHKPTELSGGQQQRVAIARALATDPDVILADEPTGNLDSKTGKIVLDFLKKLHEEQHKTIILVTHDTSLTKYADRVETLKDGRLINDENED